jgi:uncharacterized protein (TIGR02266 family)
LANTPPDNRKSKRSPVTLRIKFKSANLEQFIERYAVDVSQGGIFIRTKEPLPVGTTMRFEFQLRDESPLITGEGTVVWIREQNTSQGTVAPGMGVRFDRLTEPSQAVLDEILAYKAARGANGVATPVGEMPTRVVSAGPRKDGAGAPAQFGGEGIPEEAFEQATKVHSLEELAELSARPDTADPGKRTPAPAPAQRGPAGFDAVSDYESDDDKTKVYPALARPGGRQSGPNLDLGASGSTQRLPPAPAAGADVELGHAGYEEEDDDGELPFDTRDVELGMAGPTASLPHERTTRPDEVELGHAGVTQPLVGARPGVRPAAAQARGPAQPPARVIPLGDLGDLGESGASDPLSDVPLPEAGHFDLGQAGPTMQLRAERLGRDVEVELGAAGSNEDVEVVTAALPAVPVKEKEAAQRPIQPALVASAAAAARSPVSPDPEAHEETQERASAVVDELAARRSARRDSDAAPVVPVVPVAAAEAAGDEDVAEAADVAAAAPQALVEERAAKSGPVLRVSAARSGTEKVPAKKGLPAGLLVAVAAFILLAGAGALYLLGRGDAPAGPETAEVPAPPATDPAAHPGTNPTAAVPDQPSTNPAPTEPVAAAATPDAAAAAAEDPVIEIEPEQPEQPAAPVETVQIEVRSVPPGATASLVDGDQSGPTPMKFSLDKSKKHRVRVSLAGYASQEVELDPARPRPAPVTLAPVPWVLRFETTPPKAVVYVDGRRVTGETPNEFHLPAGWEKKKHLKVSFRLPHHQKLDIVTNHEFAAEGEAMVQVVRGTLVPGEPAPHRPAGGGTPGGGEPAPGGSTPPAGGEGGGEGGGATEPAPAPAEQPKADPPPAAPEAPSAEPPAQQP